MPSLLSTHQSDVTTSREPTHCTSPSAHFIIHLSLQPHSPTLILEFILFLKASYTPSIHPSPLLSTPPLPGFRYTTISNFRSQQEWKAFLLYTPDPHTQNLKLCIGKILGVSWSLLNYHKHIDSQDLTNEILRKSSRCGTASKCHRSSALRESADLSALTFSALQMAITLIKSAVYTYADVNKTAALFLAVGGGPTWKRLVAVRFTVAFLSFFFFSISI